MFHHLIEQSVVNMSDTDDQRRGRLLSILLLGVSVITLFSLIAVTLLETLNLIDENLNIYIVTISLFFSIFGIFSITQKGNVLLASIIFITLITLAISFADSAKELLAGRSLTFFIIPIMMASFLIRSYASFIVAGILTVEHLLLWKYANVGVDFSMFGMVGFFLFALITWLAARSIEDALNQALEVNLHLDELVEIRTKALAEANDLLADANERLTELDALKSKFVSDVSHELRTPISNISIYLEMVEHILVDIKDLPRKTLEFLTILRSETSRLNKLITEVLSASRLEQALDNLTLQPVNVQQIVQDVFNANSLTAETKGLIFTLNTLDESPIMLADSDQLKQVFTNLMANAINYTKSGRIDISTSITGQDQFVFRIQDTGIGVAEEDIAHLFERFYRGQQASLSSIPGTGLGLAITKEIVEALKGRIEIESEINAGSTFTVYFPLMDTGKRQ